MTIGVEGMMDIDIEQVLQLTTTSFVGRSAALLGITGSGKTNTAAVLIEELLSHGLPLTIVDIEGEYWGLKERFEVLVAGRSEHAELRIEPENASQIAEISLTRDISVILDLSDYTQEESHNLLGAYFTRLWEIAGKERKPYQVILEEAHEWLPQGMRSPLKTILTRIALRGRKRGLGIMLMSQRSAKVEKDVLTQTSLLFLHKVVHPTDMKVYYDLIPLPPKEIEQIVGGLQPGQVICVDNHIPHIAQIRIRHTFHAGATPEFGANEQPVIRQIDEKLLQELQTLIKSASSGPGSSEERLKKRVKELEALLAEKDADIAKKDEQIVLLSKLQVEMPKDMQLHATINMPVKEHSPIVVEAAPPQQIIAPINSSKIKSLQERLQKLTSRQRQIFKVLTEHDEAMSLDQIAAWLSVSKETVRVSMVTESFFKIGLLKRFRSGNAYLYRSLLRNFIAKEFQGTDQEEILRRLLGERR